ncbi:MAG: hypothetical protein HQL54_08475 [Magnetococcales bacterium]|nr:hypothetical protein [Magnetococcales bacterium]
MELFDIIFFFLLPIWATIRFIIAPQIKRLRIRKAFKNCPGLTLPTLPKDMNKLTRVQSKRKAFKSYRVNLYRLTCNCTRFRQFQSNFPSNHIHRLCRHLRKGLNETNAIMFYDELSQCVIGHRIKDKCYEKLTLLGTEMAFGFHPKSDFVRVYTRRRIKGNPINGPFTGPYDKFVFNVGQENWVYGEPPPGNHVIVPELIKRLMTYRSKYERSQMSSFFARFE